MSHLPPSEPPQKGNFVTIVTFSSQVRAPLSAMEKKTEAPKVELPDPNGGLECLMFNH